MRDFAYEDPVDGSRSEHQGIEVLLEDDSRIVYRLSGTGTRGATLRVYLERHVTAPEAITRASRNMLGALGRTAASLGRIEHYTGLSAPTLRV